MFVDGVVTLSCSKLPGLVAHRLQPIPLILQEDCTNAHTRSIGVQLEGGGRTREGDQEDGGGKEGGFELVECCDGIRGEAGGKRDCGAGEGGQGGGDGGVAFDKSPVEHREAEEGAQRRKVGREWVGGDGCDLGRVRADPLVRDNEAKELGLGLAE